MARNLLLAAAAAALTLSTLPAVAGWRLADGSNGQAECWVEPGASDRMSAYRNANNERFVICRGRFSVTHTRSGVRIAGVSRETNTHIVTTDGARCPKQGSRQCQ